MRLDNIVSEKFEISRSLAQKYIRDGHVSVNERQIIKTSHQVDEDDKVELFIPMPKTLELKKQDISLDIVYEDDDLFVINKPVGMLVHPTIEEREGTLVNALLSRDSTLSSIGGVIRPGIVHRLDKDTSGLILVAKTDLAHISLSKQIEHKLAKREYIALVSGVVKEDKFTVNAPIGRDEKIRVKMAVNPKGKNAITDFSVLERYSKHSLVRAVLSTGRTHQIRVHLSHAKYPIVGDPLYGSKNEKIVHIGQILTAYKIEFVHPKTAEKLTFQIELPESFKKIIDKAKYDFT